MVTTPFALPLGAGHDNPLPRLKALMEEKVRERDLHTYNHLTRASRRELPPFFTLSPCTLGIAHSIECFAQTFFDQNQTFVWVDLGAGLALPQRELAHLLHLKAPIRRPLLLAYAVDYFDWEEEYRAHSAFSQQTLLEPHLRPYFLFQDVLQATPPHKAHLVTAINVFQYVDDKLAFLCHAYNLLAPGGVFVLNQTGPVASFFQWQKEKPGPATTPFSIAVLIPFFSAGVSLALGEAPLDALFDKATTSTQPRALPSLEFFATESTDWAWVKKEGTFCRVGDGTVVVETQEDRNGYRTSYYQWDPLLGPPVLLE